MLKWTWNADKKHWQATSAWQDEGSPLRYIIEFDRIGFKLRGDLVGRQGIRHKSFPDAARAAEAFEPNGAAPDQPPTDATTKAKK
jgi:hypothetical protein